MHIPIPKKLQPPACRPLAAMRVPFLQALARRANDARFSPTSFAANRHGGSR